MPPSYIRVREVVWAYGRGQTHRQTDTQTRVITIHFASSTTHAKCNEPTCLVMCCVVLTTDLVDALSAPIQFMSQAEKRARQMQEMGIDASDIPTTSTASVAPPPSAAASAASAGVRQSQPAAAKPTAPAPDARGPSAATVAERSNSNTPSLQNAVVVDKKKGQTHASNASTHCTHRQDVHERRRSCTAGVDTKACYSHYLSFHSRHVIF